MRQAPNYLIIGDGCLAHHLAVYFKQLGIQYTQWSRKSSPFDLAKHLAGFSHAVLAISDSSIQDFLKVYDWQQHPVLVMHCSASADIEGAHFAHPLMAFARGEAYTMATYQSIPFIISEDGPDFSTLMPGLPNPSIRIQAKQRKLYHALCVLGGNCTTLLWQKFFNEMQTQFGIDKKHLLPYFNQIHHNLIHAKDPLTGPLARKDHDTLQSHITSLSSDPFARVYESFWHAYEESQHV